MTDSLPARPTPWYRRTGAAVVVVGLLLIVLTWLVAGFALWRSRADAIEDWRRFLAGTSRIASEHADQTLAAADGLLARVVDHVIAAAPRDEEALRRRLGDRETHELLRKLRDELPQIDVLTIAAADGELINFSREYPPPPIDLSDRDYFDAHIADENLPLYLSVPVRNRGTGRWTFYLTRKLYGADGRMIGLALVGIESAFFQRFYRSIEFDGGEPVMTLTRRDGRVLARYPENEKLMGQPLLGVAFRALEERDPAGESTVLVGGPRTTDPGDTRLRIVAPVASTLYPMAMTISATETVFLQNWRRSAALITAAALLASLALGAFAACVRRLLLRQTVVLGQLEQARLAAEQANQAKTAFLTSMSHEIRTPLNGVLGMTELLLHAGLAERQREMAASAHASGRTLLALLNDVLDITKIEAGRLELESLDFDLRTLISDQISLFRAPAQAKQVRLVCRMDEGLPDALRGDPVRLKQILTNLLANALKFTERGEVELTVGTLGIDTTGRHRLRFAVRDTGIGIATEALPRLFEPFLQADRSMTRRYGGSGLGLSIARDLVWMMGGTIDVHSELGVGSTFTVVVPLAIAFGALPAGPAGLPGSAGDPDDPLPPVRVLLAEDNPVNSAVAVAMLESLGLAADVAVDGAEAVEMALAGGYAAVLMDCQMPEMDGFEATRQIRARGGDRLPIVALTANAVSGDRELCLAAGMNDYLPKPFTRIDLETTLRRWLRTGGEIGAAAALLRD